MSHPRGRRPLALVYVVRLIVVVLSLGQPLLAFGQGLVRGLVDELVVGGLHLPVAAARLPDGRLLVAEKAGVVRVVVNGVLQADAFLDLRDRVNDYWDRGLLGVTIDPAFADNGYVYLFYVHEDDPLTYTGPKTSRVVRVTAEGNSADIETAVVLVDGLPADSPSHDGGAMQFGPDGRLWITTGDASSFNAVDPQALRAQQIDSLAGKLLRVDRDGRGLADNPFWNGDASAARSKVWAYGFRNPFRLTFRPSTGRPYIADVGANDWEEINAVARGGNHGWPCLEGPGPQAGYQSLAACQALYAGGPAGVVMPLVSYPHRAGTASISGGAFLTSAALPESWRGTYAFGDFARGTLHHVTVDAADTGAGPIKGLATGIDGVVDVQADPLGLLYVSVTAGEVRRVRYVPDTGPRETRYLSDAAAMITAVVNGLGPVEIDHSVGDLAEGDGGVIALGGVPFAKGLGVHAPSDLRVALAGACTAFSATVGVDDDAHGAGSVIVEVWLDGTRVVTSGRLTGGAPALSGTLDVTGRQELRLVVTDAGDGATGDRVDWADARLECVRPGGDTAPPVVVATTPVDAALDIATTTGVTASLSEDLAPASVVAGTLSLVHVASDAVVAGGVSYDAAARRVRFTPAGPLVAGAAYRAVLAGGGVADPAGNRLGSTLAWTFTTAAVSTNQAPVPSISAPATGTLFAVGDVVTFAGSATDPEDGTVPPQRLLWSVSVRHCPGDVCHTHPLLTAGGSGGTLAAPEHGADSFLIITLTATDGDGRTASVSREVHPRLASVTLRTQPTGLPVIFGERRQLSPATFEAVVGSHMNVAVLSPQQSLTFAGWVSGRPIQHVLTIGEAPVVDTAVFVPPFGVSYISDLVWSSATNGAGPVERDRSHGGAEAGDGAPLTLRGATFAKGLGVLAGSDVRIAIDGACTAFAARVGIDDEVQGGGSAYAGVLVDGRLAWASGRLNGALSPESAVVDLTGASELALVVVDAGDGPLHDHVDWADARVRCDGAGVPAAPSVVRTLTAGLTAALSWTPVAGASAYVLDAGSVPGASNLASIRLAAPGFSTTVPAGRYWLRVRALNAWGEGAPSPEAELVVDGSLSAPGAPEHLQASVVNGSVTLSWTPAATGSLPDAFVVEAGADLATLATVARTSATTLSVSGAPAGRYLVRVRATNAAGTSAVGPTITVVVP